MKTLGQSFNNNLKKKKPEERLFPNIFWKFWATLSYLKNLKIIN